MSYSKEEAKKCYITYLISVHQRMYECDVGIRTPEIDEKIEKCCTEVADQIMWPNQEELED